MVAVDGFTAALDTTTSIFPYFCSQINIKEWSKHLHKHMGTKDGNNPIKPQQQDMRGGPYPLLTVFLQLDIVLTL